MAGPLRRVHKGREKENKKHRVARAQEVRLQVWAIQSTRCSVGFGCPHPFTARTVDARLPALVLRSSLTRRPPCFCSFRTLSSHPRPRLFVSALFSSTVQEVRHWGFLPFLADLYAESTFRRPTGVHSLSCAISSSMFSVNDDDKPRD